jgi:small-conductance mechanosensitive channel
LKILLIILITTFSLLKAEENLTKEYILEKENRIQDIDSKTKNSDILIKYMQYLEFQKLSNKLSSINNKLTNLKKRRKTKAILEEIETLQKSKLALEAKLDIIGNKKSSIFENIVVFDKLEDVPKIKNPFLIFEAIRYKDNIKAQLLYYKNKYEKFSDTITLLEEKNSILNILNKSSKTLQTEINDLYLAKDIYQTKLNTLKIEVQKNLKTTDEQINAQLAKLFNLGIAIFISILIFTILKMVMKKYAEGDIYILNKTLNILNFSIIIIIIAFFYIDNATYLITILGFASAGIAIAMKDWFMNILGWFVIVTSGSFKVGDRIKVFFQNGQVQVLGDIIDITMTKIVIHEDVTLSTYMHNRRAGRIIFVPNNTIFTNPVFNYTHSGLRTVWDGIDIMITFESNHKKASYLAKEITKKYSKGYTDLTRKQLNKLRSVYNLRNTNVEPRIYTFIEEDGIKISCWYLNSYSPMNLRSTISTEILDAFKQEDDIKIAYKTHSVKLQKDDREFTEA